MRSFTRVLCPVRGNIHVAPNIRLLSFESEEISSAYRPGRFVNIRVGTGTDPLLRRPFSISRVEGACVEILFSIVGRATGSLGSAREGDTLDVLGPLGNPFHLEGEDFSAALLVAGGMGVAPMPGVARALTALGKEVRSFVGARSSSWLVTRHLPGVRTATDDGSAGFHGSVVDLLEDALGGGPIGATRIFGCGPTPMLRSLAAWALERDLPCEVSLEGAMGCGFGICQGCPVELAGDQRKFALMCTDGPAFDVRRIRL
ncbi:MAG: dihydroorotate dehydrogenase electron transfer subunit [Bacteroidota bacterium]